MKKALLILALILVSPLAKAQIILDQPIKMPAGFVTYCSVPFEQVPLTERKKINAELIKQTEASQQDIQEIIISSVKKSLSKKGYKENCSAPSLKVATVYNGENTKDYVPPRLVSMPDYQPGYIIRTRRGYVRTPGFYTEDQYIVGGYWVSGVKMTITNIYLDALTKKYLGVTTTSRFIRNANYSKIKSVAVLSTKYLGKARKH